MERILIWWKTKIRNKEDPIQVVKSVSLNIKQRDFKNLFNKLD